jgi:hypothetical protein
MRIGAVLRRWIEILAALYLAWCESRRELRSLVVSRENGHVVVRHAEPARDAMLRDAQAGNIVATLPPGAGGRRMCRVRLKTGLSSSNFPPTKS